MYKLISAPTTYELEQKTNKLLEEGFRLFGTTSAATCNNQVLFVQAFTKNDENIRSQHDMHKMSS